MIDIEEIREGVFDIVQNVDNLYPKDEEKVEAILSYLAEKEACFPVEVELPRCDVEYNPMACGAEDDTDNCYRGGWDLSQLIMLKAGYKKVITLKEMMGGDK